MVAFQAGDPGSIPGRRTCFLIFHQYLKYNILAGCTIDGLNGATHSLCFDNVTDVFVLVLQVGICFKLTVM